MTQATSFPWPEGRQCAISITFDDGLRSRLAAVYPPGTDVGREVPVVWEHGAAVPMLLSRTFL